MLSRDVAIHDIDAAQWLHLRKLIEPDYSAYARGGARTLPLVVLLENGRPVKAVRPGQGRVPLDTLKWYGPALLERARLENGGSFLLAIEVAAVRSVLRTVEERVRLGEDIVAQGLHVLRAIRGAMGQGIYLTPRRIGSMPIPSFEAVQQTFDLLVADNSTIVAYIFKGLDPYASLILTKRHGDIVEITTHRYLGTHVRNWRFDYQKILADAERRCAKPHIGFFASLDVWTRIVAGTSRLSLEVAQRNVILDPAPPWLLGLLAADVGVQVAKVGLGLLSRFVPAPVLETARGVAATALEQGPFSLLGFDPFALAGQLLRMREPPA